MSYFRLARAFQLHFGPGHLAVTTSVASPRIRLRVLKVSIWIFHKTCLPFTDPGVRPNFLADARAYSLDLFIYIFDNLLASHSFD